MAKMFYTAEEAADRLDRTEEELKGLVREGKLREFRDAGTVNYKVGDVDALVESASPAVDNADSSEDSALSASASGDILLEPVEDSSIEFAPTGSDIIDLEESESSLTASGTAAATKAKEDTVVPSVGVNVFDDEELDEQVDPLAQTAVTDVAGLGMEGAGSGSGILDLTRESDDTSLGQELLDEIYTGEGKEQEEGTIEMGEDTRAGLDEAIPEGSTADEEEAEEATPTAQPDTPVQPMAAVVTEVVQYGPDPVSTGLTAAMVVAVAVMWFAGLGAAALVRGITPSLLEAVYSRLSVYTLGMLVVTVIAGAAAFLVSKKRTG
jgi:hypothetical protein